MQKVYLKYSEDKVEEECDFGFVKALAFVGFIYPLIKKNYKMFFIILSVEVAVAILIMFFILPPTVGIIATICMIILINILFAANYNMIVIEEYLKKGYVPYDYNSSDLLLKKGIYFKIQ